MILPNDEHCPETEYEEYTEDVSAGYVQKGDVINGRMVATNKVGTKWSEIRNPDGELIFRVTVDTPITVTRRKQTEESRKADARWDAKRRILRQLESLEGQENPALDVAVKVINSDYRYFDYSDFGTMMQRQAEWRVNAQFRAAYEHVLDSPEEKWSGDLLDFTKEFIEDLSKRLVHKAQYIANKSSNQFSNMMEEYEVQAMGKFIDDAKWWGA